MIQHNEILIMIILFVFVILSYSPSDQNCGCNKIQKSFGLRKKNGICFSSDFRTIISQILTGDMVHIHGGRYSVGTNKPIIVADGEAPEREVYVDDFYIDKYEVNNAEFKKFIDATGYETDAEKYGDSFVLYSLIKNLESKKLVSAVANVPWWLSIRKANWFHPEGPDSKIAGLHLLIIS